MKIAIFTDSFFPGIGGTEKATAGLAETLSKNNEVVVCAPSYGRKHKDNYNYKVFRARGIKVTNNDVYAFPNCSKKFKKQLEEFSPDIIHCQSVSPMTRYALKYGKKHGVPVLMTVHTKFKETFSASIKCKCIVNAMIKDLVKKLRRSDMVFTVSNDMAKELFEYGFDGEVKVIKNGAMFKKIENVESLKAEARKENGISDDANVFLYVGHITKYKNLQFTIDSLKILKEKMPNFKMFFVGHGLDDEYFKKYVANIGLENNVVFTGQIGNPEELSKLFSMADLYLFSSVFDNDSLTIVEAALHKVPTLAIENTGSSERLENNVSGFTVELSTKAFADKIYNLMQNKAMLKKVGEMAEKLVPKTWEKTAEEYFEFYKEAKEKKFTIGGKKQ